MTFQKRYIFITGGVLSSLGKGLTSASIATLLESRGIKVALLKFDPYLNVDPGTMNPYQHGEVYVTDDGAETDLDLGHYFRFTKASITKASNATSGQIYDHIIKRERRGEFLGQTVQVIPHITDEIKQRIRLCASVEKETQVTLIEIGGTVGDIESQPYLEAIRQFHLEHPTQCLNIHLTYVPYLKAAGELKTKPTQHSVQFLRQAGVFPNLILCRCENPLPEEVKRKISLFCSVPEEAVFDEPDVKTSIYEVPLFLRKQGIDRYIARMLALPKKKPKLPEWEAIVKTIKTAKKSVTIAVVGKYVEHQDAYKSLFEALYHAAIHHKVKLSLKLIDSEKHAINAHILKGSQGVLVPGGFGERGFEGKVAVAHYCREKKVPYFGICLGMQVMAVEFARNALGLKEANSTEIDPDTPYSVIALLSEQRGIKEMGGTMRLGAYTFKIKPHSKAQRIYKKLTASERHRHRYEFNNHFKPLYEENGFIISGSLPLDDLCEIAEIRSHPWMIGVQFHPEFKSKPLDPHPLFVHFIEAAIKYGKNPKH